MLDDFENVLRGKADELMGSFREAMKSFGDAQNKRAALTANATSADKRVTVSVNADGVVIDVKFADDIDELTYTEIASAVVSTAQEAAQEVKRRSEDLIADFRRRREEFRNNRGGILADMPSVGADVGGLSDVMAEWPKAPEVSLAPPGSPERKRSEQQAGRDGGNDGVVERSW